MKKKSLLLLLAGIMISPLTSFAFNASAGDNITLSTTTKDDYYAAAGNININANIDGDVCSAGGKIFINSNIAKDLMSFAGENHVSGTIGESARIIGAKTEINSTIEKDLLVAAGELKINKEANIKGETHILAEEVILAGQTNNTNITAKDITLQGTINGNTTLKFENITIDSGAKIKGNLSYEASEQNTGLELIVDGKVNFIEKNYNNHKEVSKILGGISGTRFAFLFVFGLILLFVGHKRIKPSLETIQKHARESLAYGFLAYGALPIATLFLVISLIGIPFAFITTVTFISLLIFYKLLNVYFYSNLLIEKWGGYTTLNNRKKIGILFGCALLSGILSTVDIIFAFFALGAIIKTHIIKKK